MELLEIHFVCLGLAVLLVRLCVSAHKYGLRAFFFFSSPGYNLYAVECFQML